MQEFWREGLFEDIDRRYFRLINRAPSLGDEIRWDDLGVHDIFETFRAMADALREHFSRHGPTPLYVVIGRGGPNLVRGMSVMRDTMEALGLPYRIFGFDSDMSEVVDYARKVNDWMKAGGREQLAAKLKIAQRAAPD